jgi:thioesterase domain-containing protein
MQPALRRSELGLKNASLPPATPVEEAIAAAFLETFDLDEVGVEDDFFELGGDSLSAETLALSIFNRTGKDFQIAWLLNQKTPRSIAALLDTSGERAAAADRPPLFMVHGRGGIMLPSKEFLDGFAKDQKVVFFELPGLRGQGEILESVEAIAARYVEELVDAYPAGPIVLGGACMGCLITIEMAAQLAAKGRAPLALALMDPEMPATRRERRGEHRNVVDAVLFAARGVASPVLGRADDEERARIVAFRKRAFGALRGRKRKNGKAIRGSISISERAKALLIGAYERYRPRSFGGRVDIVASAQRLPDYESAKGLWAPILPNRQVYPMPTTAHRDLYHSDLATEATARLQACIDEALAGAGRQL